jgi:hypothetical protein
MGQFGGRQPFNFYIPNNQTSWRNIREQRGKGLGDLTPEQLDAIKTGAANVADISYETRRAIFPKNRVSKVNVKFKNQPGQQEFKGAPNLMPGQKGFDPTVPGQPATTTAPAPVQNQQTAPAPGTQGMSPYGPYMNEYLFGPDNAPSVNAQVAAQQAANRAAASSTPSFENLSGEIEMPADEVLKNMPSNPRVSQAPSNATSMDPNVAAKKAAMQTPSVNQPFIDAQKPKYTIGKVIPSATPNGSLQSWADIEKAIGPTPEVITGSYFEKINDYCSQFPGAQGCYSEPYSKLPNQENIGSNERRNYFDTEKFKQMPYVQQVLMAIQSPSFRRGVNDEVIDPYEVIGAPFRLAADYDTGNTGEYYKTSRDGNRTSSPTPFTDVDPAYRFRYSDDTEGIYSQFMTPKMARELGSQVYMPLMMNPGARKAWQEEADRTYKEVGETGESGSLDREKLLKTFVNPEDAKNANYPLYLKGKQFLESDANKTLPTFTNVPPSQIDRRGMGYLQNAYYNKPESMFGEETEEERYIRAINAKNSTNRPVDIINEMAKKENWDPAFTKKVLQSKDKSLVRPTVVYKGYERPTYSNFTQDEDFGYGPAINQKYGGPYVLPMYQGMTGPSQTGSQYVDPSAQAEPADQGEFEVGVDVSRVKNFDYYFPGKVQMFADVFGKIGQNSADKNLMRRMMRPDQWANNVGQYRGWTAFNNPVGANSAPDQMVPVSQYGGMMMYDVADLFFLTPQMLKKTKGKK